MAMLASYSQDVNLRVMSAPPGLHPPTLNYDTSRKELASPLRRRATSNLREEWFRSKQDLPEIRGHGLNIMRTPVQMLKRRAERSHLCRPKRVTSAADGLLTPRRKIECNKEFEREWKNEVKRNVPSRPKYVVEVPVATPKRKESIDITNMTPFTMFYRSHTTLTSELQRESKHRHFVMPEWRSEFVDWLRYRHKSTQDVHKYSLF